MAQPTVGITVIIGSKMKRGYKKDAVGKAMLKVIKHLEKQFAKTTKTWNHKPKFHRSIGVTAISAKGSVSTDDEQYGWVNNGVDARPITPKKGPRLHFQEDFTPKTRPRVIGSRQGGKSGAWTHPTSAPNWPGIEPREFDKVIAEEAQPVMDKSMRAAMEAQIFPHHSGGSN